MKRIAKAIAASLILTGTLSGAVLAQGNGRTPVKPADRAGDAKSYVVTLQPGATKVMKGGEKTFSIRNDSGSAVELLVVETRARSASAGSSAARAPQQDLEGLGGQIDE